MTNVTPKGMSYSDIRSINERCCAMINAAWQDKVAWVEDTTYFTASGASFIWPAIKSRLVNGQLIGRRDVPPFNPGPAIGTLMREGR